MIASCGVPQATKEPFVDPASQLVAGACLCMYVCIYIYIYIYMYVSLSLSLCICIYIYIYTHTHTHMYTHVYMLACWLAYASFSKRPQRRRRSPSRPRCATRRSSTATGSFSPRRRTRWLRLPTRPRALAAAVPYRVHFVALLSSKSSMSQVCYFDTEVLFEISVGVCHLVPIDGFSQLPPARACGEAR